jgi:hypothetical protein
MSLIEQTYWTDGDALEQTRCWNAKFTEVLVPNSIDPGYLEGIYVGTAAAHKALSDADCPLPVSINRRLFFR